MDATRRVACNNELFNPVLTMGMQVSCILVLSHFFQLVLKPLGQPGPVAQILAGFVLGPSGLAHITYIKKLFFQNMAGDYYETMALFARIIIMFVIGLEMDVPCLIRNLQRAITIACGSCLTGSIFAAAITSFVYQQTGSHGSIVFMAATLAVIFTNSSSPIVIRMAAELKFANSETGRLAIASSLSCDMYSVVILVLMSYYKKDRRFAPWSFEGFCWLILVVTVIIVNVYLANWLNKRNRDQKHLKNAEVLAILSLVVATALMIESRGYNSIIACFLMGSMFPRGGKTARTLLPKLTYTVHNFILPIYFGYTGFQADITSMASLRNVFIIFIIVLVSLGSKISGTLLACHYLKIPLRDGVFLAFLMDMKGHVDLLTITLGLQGNVLGQSYYGVMMTSLAINSLLIGPIITIMVRREKETLAYRHIAFERQDPEQELRVLACVHGPRPVSTMLGLILASRGSEKVPLTPYLMHLIELPEKSHTNSMYHREDDDLSDDDEENYGGNDVVEINDAVDTFTAESGMVVQQVKTVSPYTSMYLDVCDRAEDMRASIILLPFHKHQRIDGKMESDKEGIRTTNQKILRHARCTVSIVVDRGLHGPSQASGSESLQHVAILFFGGPDDREALGYSRRLGMYHHINLTVIRFLPASVKEQHKVGFSVAQQADDVLMAIPENESENAADRAVLTDFYNRYVTSGKVGYVEKYLENGTETANALRDMADMYALFIVGKGGRGHSPLTTGISDWEECPELGTVGDLLASSDFDISGSVMVIQQHRGSQTDDDR